MSDDGLIDLIRREAAIAVAQMRQSEGIVVCTSYNPQKHTMRGVLVPHMIETGDIVIGTNAIGNGYGEVTGPNVGDPQKLDGDMFNVNFGMGDSNMPIATHRIFSSLNKPPVVQSGEWKRITPKGQTVFFDQNGNATVSLSSGTKVVLGHDNSVTLTHGPTGSMFQIDKDGNQLHDAKGKSVTIQNTSGITFNSDVTVTGSTTLAGSGTLGGLPIQTA